MSFDDGFMLGLSLGGGGGGSGGGDEWTPPEDWIPVPEPGEYEAYFLIDITDSASHDFYATFVNYEDYSFGSSYVDWGDGNAGIWDGKTHTYSNAGQYLVKYVVDAQHNGFYRVGGTYPLLIAKLGSGIRIMPNTSSSNSHLFANQHRLKYVSCFESEIPEKAFFHCYNLERYDGMENIKSIEANAFSGCVNLKKVKLPLCEHMGTYAFGICEALQALEAPSCISIGERAFYSCRVLSKISIESCTSIGDYAFNLCSALLSVNIPLCVSIGTQGFAGCFNLYNFTANESCTYGDYCFRSCVRLNPRPDGSEWYD